MVLEHAACCAGRRGWRRRLCKCRENKLVVDYSCTLRQLQVLQMQQFLFFRVCKRDADEAIISVV